MLIVSHDVFNERSGTVIAMALTSQPQRAGFPLTLELKNPKLKKSSWLKISQIRTLSVERIGKRLGTVSARVSSRARRFGIAGCVAVAPSKATSARRRRGSSIPAEDVLHAKPKQPRDPERAFQRR